MNEDWQGSRPKKFSGGKKIVQPVYSQTTTEGLLGETSEGLVVMKGKKHFQQSECKEVMQWKPCVKKIDNPNPSVPKEPERKHLSPVIKTQKPRPEKKHIQFSPSRSNKPEVPQHTKMVTVNGIRVQDLPTSEYNDHKQLIGLKKRINGTEQMRNGISYKAPGDKSYKKPEQSAGFFKEGGLVAGSTQKPRIPHKAKKSVANIQETESTGTRWTDRVKNEVENEEKDQVNSLVDWEKQVLATNVSNYKDPDLSD